MPMTSEISDTGQEGKTQSNRYKEIDRFVVTVLVSTVKFVLR